MKRFLGQGTSSAEIRTVSHPMFQFHHLIEFNFRVRYVTSLYLSFPNCKIEVITLSTLEYYVNI